MSRNSLLSRKEVIEEIISSSVKNTEQKGSFRRDAALEKCAEFWSQYYSPAAGVELPKAVSLREKINETLDAALSYMASEPELQPYLAKFKPGGKLRNYLLEKAEENINPVNAKNLFLLLGDIVSYFQQLSTVSIAEKINVSEFFLTLYPMQNLAAKKAAETASKMP